MKIGDRILTKIGDVAFGGDGVGRSQDLVIFVPFTVDGDEAEVEITEVKKRYARARLIRIIAPSHYRTTPRCLYYARCGGCRMQQVAYPHQLELKRRQVAETFRRIAKLSLPPVAPVIASPRPYGYRGKAEFHLAGERGEPRRMGLMASASHDLIEVERCEIVDESINRKYRSFREAFLRGLLSTRNERQLFWSDEPDESPTEVVTGSITGHEITRMVGGKRITVPYGGFFQANAALVGELVEQVVMMSALSGRETVVDAYCGAGLFTLFLGPRAERIFGIEGAREAVRCAGLNLCREGLMQKEVFSGDVADILENEFAARGIAADVVVLDPPRDGCGKGVIDAVASMRPERIVYVSCNPATQARDVRLLAERGYTLHLLQPLDMFPQTAHIEVVALLVASVTRKPALLRIAGRTPHLPSLPI
ncbi:MAG: class I SAM-dependent RNA methyltransferase [Pseudomonadota bacterium]